jgi:uncharacterized protein YciI
LTLDAGCGDSAAAMNPALASFGRWAAALMLCTLTAHAQVGTPAPPPASENRLYAVEVKTGPQWNASKAATEQAFFREHSANLKRLRDAGHIVLGARYSDKGLLIFTAPSAASVQALMDQDPSVAHGTFRYEVHEFNVFYPGAVQARPQPPR